MELPWNGKRDTDIIPNSGIISAGKPLLRTLNWHGIHRELDMNATTELGGVRWERRKRQALAARFVVSAKSVSKGELD